MNILLTASGRRTYLVRYFQEALRAHGRGLVVTANSTPDAPAMAIADRAIVVPPSHHAEYAEAIVAVCRRFDIGLLCSCHDLDVLALAPQRDRLREMGVVAMLPDEEWARLCLDKFACGERLKAAGFVVPWASVSIEETRAALARGEAQLPLIVKARLGFGSLALHRCQTLEQLNWFHDSTLASLQGDITQHFYPLPVAERAIIQESVAGVERCIDIVNDLTGRHAAHFICEVHGMRAGESDSATTIDRDALGDLPHRLSQLTHHIGIWGVDVLMDGQQPKIIDVNPRFTGDYPFQHIAGANIPAAMIAWAQGAKPDPAWLEPGVGVSGYKDLVPMRRDEQLSHAGLSAFR